MCCFHEFGIKCHIGCLQTLMDQSLSHQPSPGLSSAYLWPLSVWLTASLLIHTLRLPHSPAALAQKKKKNLHAYHTQWPQPVVEAGLQVKRLPHPVIALCMCANYVVWRHIRKHGPLTDYSLLLLGLPQAHSCPELESYMYKQFVIF